MPYARNAHRPDARVARALAEIVAETDTGSRRLSVYAFRDELAARLGDASASSRPAIPPTAARPPATDHNSKRSRTPWLS